MKGYKRGGSLEDQFWSRVASRPEDECWRWAGRHTYQGYATFNHNRKFYFAHRVSAELSGREIPPDKVIDHVCRNKGCVNPAHLEVVTQRTNTLRADGPTAANAYKTHCLRGHELSGGNLRVTPKGWRVCRTCHREAAAAAPSLATHIEEERA